MIARSIGIKYICKKHTLMKKLLLLLGASSLAFGQNLLFEQKPLTSDFTASIDVISSANYNEKMGIYVADDFELPTNSSINKIKFTGHIENGFFDLQNLLSWRVSFYNDNGGKPASIPNWTTGGMKMTFENFATSPNVVMTTDPANAKILNVEWNIPSSVVYNANTKYWVVLYSVMNNLNDATFMTAKKHFYWAASTMNLPKLETAKIVDPNDLLGSGYTNWTNVNQVSSMVSGMAFSLYGSNALATSEVSRSKVTVYPNPATDQLTVTHNDKKLKQATVFSADGKLLQSSTSTLIDVKKLAVGQYIIKVDFQDGTSTSVKFIKN